MNNNIHIKIHQGAISALRKDIAEALVKTAEAVHTDLVQSQTVPRKDGTLQNEATFVDVAKGDSQTVVIASTTPYARRLYFHPEYNFSKAENMHAGGQWFEPYLTGKKQDFAKKAFSKFISESRYVR